LAPTRIFFRVGIGEWRQNEQCWKEFIPDYHNVI
jgi:hypothetical protein